MGVWAWRQSPTCVWTTSARCLPSGTNASSRCSGRRWPSPRWSEPLSTATGRWRSVRRSLSLPLWLSCSPPYFVRPSPSASSQLFSASTGTGFSVLFNSIKAPGLGFATRYLFTLAIGRLLRAITFVSTILPSVRPWCASSRYQIPLYPHPWAQKYYEPYASDPKAIRRLIQTDTHYANVKEYPVEYRPDWGHMSFLVDILRPSVSEGSKWYHLLKKASGGCNDLMYSGHMLVAVLTAMAWTEAYGGWTSALIWLLLLHSSQREVRERHHYSVDCIVAIYVGILLWRMTGFIWSAKDTSRAKRLSKLEEVQSRLIRAAKDSDIDDIRKLLNEVELAGQERQSSSQLAIWAFAGIATTFLFTCILLAFIWTSDG
ncbi:protein PHLOEM UNLOADING MODULATOR isoform X2 [Elaeis guineensis]|uniref:Uncharacterized protein LOC105051988 isoform X2 n=1 Tax=Elaeis guineensis var. tenera TaxID=51953 RepID=A0A6J0PN11_ELAGV|nr:uncharacterized protein LOC105051988 isoform X2 [Elaeis guineensis]